MSGTTHDNHLDYREAFVLNMEMVAHENCKPCILAALKSSPDDACVEMKHMREYIKRCYEALPPHYKQRYEDATRTALQHVNETVKGITGGR